MIKRPKNIQLAFLYFLPLFMGASAVFAARTAKERKYPQFFFLGPFAMQIWTKPKSLRCWLARIITGIPDWKNAPAVPMLAFLLIIRQHKQAVARFHPEWKRGHKGAVPFYIDRGNH